MELYQTRFAEKLKEALTAVSPTIGIVLLLSFTIAPIPPSILLLLLFGAVLLIIGMMFFTLGAELAMTPVGEKIGTRIANSRNLGIVLLLCFLLGFIITISEPDLQVLAEQVPSVPNAVLILAVLLLGLLYHPESTGYAGSEIPVIRDSVELWRYFAAGLPKYIEEIAVSLLPIILFFAVFQMISLKMRGRPLKKIVIGMVYTYVGLVLFLTGVNVGFMPAGNYLGAMIAGLSYRWVLIPIGMVIGYFIVKAEPAVYVLKEQVEEITSGAISGEAMGLSLSLGVSVSIGLAMIRVLTGISIFWFILPGYLIALALSFFVPKIFTAIAFDSGGVASGPMTATFLLPFAMGACEAVGGNIVQDAFGVVAMVAMTPLITIQIMGAVYKYRFAHARAEEALEASYLDIWADDDIIEL